MSSTVEIQSYWESPQALASIHSTAALTSARGPLSAKARAALQAQEGFAAAMRKTAQGMLVQHHGNRLLNLIVNDRGRFVVGMIALDLHFHRGAAGIGLTPGRLRDACARTGTCSPARASALLTLMRLGDFVRAAPSAQDRRLRELVPTERLIAAHRARWRCHLEASAPLLVDAEQALAVVDEDFFVPAMVRQLTSHYRAGFRILEHVPALRLFGERTGGMFVVLALFASADTDAMRGGARVQVSISELARRIGTSRTHVIKLFNDAAAQGLVHRPDGGGIVVTERLIEATHDFVAMGYLLLAHAAKHARDGAKDTLVAPSATRPTRALAGETAAR